MSQVCVFCGNGIDSREGRHYLNKIGNKHICEFCLNDFVDILELNSITNDITSLKSRLGGLDDDQEQNEYDIDELKKVIKELEENVKSLSDKIK